MRNLPAKTLHPKPPRVLLQQTRWTWSRHPWERKLTQRTYRFVCTTSLEHLGCTSNCRDLIFISWKPIQLQGPGPWTTAYWWIGTNLYHSINIFFWVKIDWSWLINLITYPSWIIMSNYMQIVKVPTNHQIN